MDWNRLLFPSAGEWMGTRFFSSLAVGGVVLMVLALSGVYINGLLERVCGFFFGAAVSVGSSGTLALAYADLTEDGRFAWKVAVRAAFLPLAPLGMAMDLSFFLSAGVWPCVLLSCLTVVPFGLSLLRLILKKRNSH